MLQTPNSEPPELRRRATSGHVVSWVFFFVMRYRWKFDWSRRRQVGAGTRVSLAWAKLFDVGGVSSDHLRPFHHVSHAPWKATNWSWKSLLDATLVVVAGEAGQFLQEPVWPPTFGPFYSQPTCCCLFPEPISRQPWFCAVCRQSRSLPSPADIGYRGGISRNFPEICNSTSLITFWLEVSTDAFMELSFWEPILVDVPRLWSVLGDF